MDGGRGRYVGDGVWHLYARVYLQAVERRGVALADQAGDEEGGFGRLGRLPADFYTSNVSVDVKSTVRQTSKNVDLIGNAVKASQSKGKLIHRLEMKSHKSTLRSSNVRAKGVGVRV